MSFLGNLFDPLGAVQGTWDTLSMIPGSPEALGTGIYGGLDGSLSWNPYSQDNSVWDTGAGGTELSKDPKNRQIGRSIGTAIGAAFTGGALGGLYGAAPAAAGAEAGAGSSALAIGAGTAETAAAPALSLSSQGAIDAAAAGYGGASGAGLADAAQRGATRGAIGNATSTAAQGGNGDDILKSGLYGGLYGGVGGGINYGLTNTNPGSYVTDNSSGQQIINKGISGGVQAGLQGKNVGQGALLGAGVQGGNMLLNGMFSSPEGDNAPIDTSYSNYGTNGFAPTAAQPADTTGGMAEDQQNPLKRFLSGGSQYSLGNGASAATPGASLGGMAAPAGGGIFGGSKAGGNSNLAGNLLGLYSAYQQHAANSKLQSGLQSMYAPGSAYAQQLAQQLARSDAASGRRSQVGTRAVELQARLADLNSRNAPQIAALNNNNNNGMNAGLNNLFQLYQGAGGYDGIAKTAQPYLSQLGSYFGG